MFISYSDILNFDWSVFGQQMTYDIIHPHSLLARAVFVLVLKRFVSSILVFTQSKYKVMGYHNICMITSWEPF